MKRCLSMLVSVLVISIGETSAAQVLDQVIVFGDSTVDSGYYRALPSPAGGANFNADWPAAVAAGAGKPTSSPGLMHSELLALYLGLTAAPANQGGTNYATSGAKNVTVNTAQTGGFQAAIPTVTQIANYLGAHSGQANPYALYLISSGSNDVTYALGQTGSGPFPVDPNAYLVGAANSLVTAIKSLQTAGAAHFIVPNLAFSFPTNDATKRAARKLYTDTLFAGLASQGVSVVQADYNSVFGTIFNNPAQFGITSTGTGPGAVACTQPAGITSAWALLCSSNPSSPSHFASPGADQTSLFADDQHLATTAQRLLANYFYSLVRPTPAAAVALNASAFHAGQTLAYQASFTAGSIPAAVDVYLGVLLPDGLTLVSFVQGSPGVIAFVVGPSPAPFSANLTLASLAVPFSFTFAGSEPPGTYIAYAALTVAGSNPLLPASVISLSFQPFQFSP